MKSQWNVVQKTFFLFDKFSDSSKHQTGMEETMEEGKRRLQKTCTLQKLLVLVHVNNTVKKKNAKMLQIKNDKKLPKSVTSTRY